MPSDLKKSHLLKRPDVPSPISSGRPRTGTRRMRCPPMPSQVPLIIRLRQALSFPSPVAFALRGPDLTGKSAVEEAGIRLAGKTTCLYHCVEGSSAHFNLQQIGELIDARLTQRGAEGLVLLVLHPELSTCSEALVGGTKRLAAAARVPVVFEVGDDVRSDDTIDAFRKRTRGISTVAPLAVSLMTSGDARRVTGYLWDRSFAGRCMPEYLSGTMSSISRGRIGKFPDAWRFAERLFDGAAFVAPGSLWEFLRPSDEEGEIPLGGPRWPSPFYPDRREILELEAFLDLFDEFV